MWKICPPGLCKNGGFGPALLNPAWTEPSGTPSNTLKQLKRNQNTQRRFSSHPRTTPENYIHPQTTLRHSSNTAETPPRHSDSLHGPWCPKVSGTALAISGGIGRWVELCHFLNILGLSERINLWQSFWITLYVQDLIFVPDTMDGKRRKEFRFVWCHFYLIPGPNFWLGRSEGGQKISPQSLFAEASTLCCIDSGCWRFILRDVRPNQLKTKKAKLLKTFLKIAS